jgi:hypothetical protein
MQLLLAAASAVAMTPALAAIDPTGPIPITAEQAFDAVATGCLPDTPEQPGACYGVGKVILVDVRTQTEVDFQGGPAKVDTIVLKDGTEIVPDLGKAILTQDGKFLEYTLEGKKKNLKVDTVKEVLTSLIGKVAPCSTYTPGPNPGEGKFEPDADGFSAAMTQIAAEAGGGTLVAITMCNSGGRSTQCPLAFISEEAQDLYALWYEIDRAGDMYITPEIFGTEPFVAAGAPPPGIHMAVLGGYSGSDYGGDYNGIIGFPGRQTQKQPISGWVVSDPDAPLSLRLGAPSGPAVSWKDSGLPIYIPAVQCILPPPAP